MRPFVAALVLPAFLMAPTPALAEESSGLDELVDLAAQRLQTADPVAASKWISGGPITDPARVQQVLAGVAAAAESAGLPSDFATEILTDQINATEAVQYGRFSGWKLNPDGAPNAAPDLSATRTLIDELTLRMVTELADDWPVLSGDSCATALSAAKAAVAERRGLDGLYREALDAATRSYCR